jgi:UDP-N-acetylglucosamine 4,6-dehydratase
MSDIFADKTILLTGGTGSFGHKFTEILLKEYNSHALRIFSRDEKKQFDMMNQFHDERLRFFIGDVRDYRRLQRAMVGVDIVIHAAALKQVPACEFNPIEAVKTNIDGAINIIDSALNNEVDKVITISTDKAVHPVNLYGAKKMTAEKLFIQGNAYSGLGQTKFSCVRYGNVIGSRGSVIPTFLKQKEEKLLTITNDRMTRFWLSLEQGVRFVIKFIEKMQGGEIFIPKIPSMKIIDLADAIAPTVKRQITGIRPGEKIHELLLTEDEARHSLEFKDFFIIEPEHVFWKEKKLDGGKKPLQGFSYSSDKNDKWLTKNDLLVIIKQTDSEEKIMVY